MKEINPVTISQKEYLTFMVDNGNFIRKVDELNKLLKEVNDKIAIANTVRLAEKLKRKAEVLIKQGKDTQKRLSDQEEKQKKKFVDKTETIEKKGLEISLKEDELIKKQNKLRHQEDVHQNNIKALETEKELFEAKRKEDMNLYNELSARINNKQKELDNILSRLIDEVTSL